MCASAAVVPYQAIFASNEKAAASRQSTAPKAVRRRRWIKLSPSYGESNTHELRRAQEENGDLGGPALNHSFARFCWRTLSRYATSSAGNGHSARVWLFFVRRPTRTARAMGTNRKPTLTWHRFPRRIVLALTELHARWNSNKSLSRHIREFEILHRSDAQCHSSIATLILGERCGYMLKAFSSDKSVVKLAARAND